MPVYSAFLLAAAGFAAADKLAAMNLGEATLRNVTVAGPGAASFGVHSLSDGCGIGMTTCDVNCMPLTGICCGLGNGAYCDIGYACVDNGCCPVGKVCNGPPTGCEGDRDLCGEFCVPKGTCDGSGGSGGSGGCPSGYEACDDECMPAGSVCCHNGYHCDAGQTCTSDFKCRLGGSSGGGGGSGGGSSSGGDGGDDGPTSSIDDSFTSRGSGSGSLPTTYSLSPDPEPTAAPTESNPFGGDDVFTSTEDNSQPTPTNKASTTPRPTSNGSSGSGSGGGSSNGGSNGDDGDDDGNGGSGGAKNGDSSSSSSDDDGSSGTMNAPSLIVGLLALVAFVL